MIPTWLPVQTKWDTCLQLRGGDHTEFKRGPNQSSWWHPRTEQVSWNLISDQKWANFTWGHKSDTGQMFCRKSRVTSHLPASQQKWQEAVMEEGVGRGDGELEERLGRRFPSSFDEEFASRMIYILDEEAASPLCNSSHCKRQISKIKKRHRKKKIIRTELRCEGSY